MLPTIDIVKIAETIEAEQAAMDRLLRIKIGEESDGSNRLMRCFASCVSLGLDEDSALSVVTDYLEECPAPVEWGEDKLRRCYADAARRKKDNPEDQAKPKPGESYRSEAITLDVLELEPDEEREYLISDFMVKGEPMIIGGPSKSLKTSISLEMAIALSHGQKFLGTFDVPTPQKVMYISGESGKHTTKETAKVIKLARDWAGLPGGENLHVSFRLPKLDDVFHVDDLLRELDEKKITVCFIDPLYRSLRVGNDAQNIYAMGARLELLAERINEAGITTVLLHHFKKQGKTWAEPPELEDLSQSGISEFGRQFLLLKRREQYQWDGKHLLWFSWGGSAGHQGSLLVGVDTGTRAKELKWQTNTWTHQQYAELAKDAKKVAKAGGEDDGKGELIALIRENPGLSCNQIQDELGLDKRKILKHLTALEEAGIVRHTPGPRGAKNWFVH